MPYLRIETNIAQEKIPKDFPVKLCNVLAKSLGKPLGYCCATIVGDVNLSWGGTNEPAAQATLASLGSLGPSENKKISKAISQAVSETIDVSPDRMYIMFNNVEGHNVGYNGGTF